MLLHCLRSLTCFHSRWSSLIAFSHFCLSSSSDTPSTVKFLFLYLLYAATTFGFSPRHGPHQLAQKSTKTYLPFNWLNEKGLSSTSFMVKSGAMVPTPGLEVLVGLGS